MKEELKQEFQEIGAMEALVEGVKEGVGAFIDGVGELFDIAQSSPALNDMANHGRSEIAAALFGQSDAYVMYMKGAHGQPASENEAEEPSVEVENPEITQSRGIHM